METCMRRRAVFRTCGIALLTPAAGCLWAGRGSNGDESGGPSLETLSFRHDRSYTDAAVTPIRSEGEAEDLPVPDDARDEYDTFVDGMDFEAEHLVVLQVFFPSNAYELRVDGIDSGESDEPFAVEATRTGTFGPAKPLYETAVIRGPEVIPKNISARVQLHLDAPRDDEPDVVGLRPVHSPDYTVATVGVVNDADAPQDATVGIEHDGEMVVEESVTVDPSSAEQIHQFDHGGTHEITVTVEDVGTITRTAHLPISSPDYRKSRRKPTALRGMNP